MPQKGSSARAIAPHTLPSKKHVSRAVKTPTRIQLRSVPAPPRRTIEKKRRTIEEKHRKYRLQHLSEALHTRILDFCNLKPELKGRYLATSREAFSLARTNTRFFNLFRERVRHIDGFYPARRGYPASCVPHYLQQTQMCWLARLAQSNLSVMRLPDYQNGSADVLVAVEFCCRALKELSFTDNGSVFPKLANSLFVSCKQISKIEIRAPERGTVHAMADGLCNFKEVVLLDVRIECLTAVCRLIETKGLFMNTLRVACDIPTNYDTTKRRVQWSKDDMERFQSFCDYIKRHAFQELPQVYELDISTSRYHNLGHDPYDMLDRADKPGQLLLSRVSKLIERERNTKKKLVRRPRRRIRLLRFRCIDIDEMYGLLVNHLPVQEAMNLDTVFPGGSACFNVGGDMAMRMGSLQMGMHVMDVKSCFRGSSNAKVVDLGSWRVLKQYSENGCMRKEIGKLLIRGCENVETLRGVFPVRREWLDMAYNYISKAIGFAMLTRTMEVSYEVVMYGHGVDAGFRGMVGSWGGLEMLRLVNPGNYGCEKREMSEGECVQFLGGLQWLIELLKDCKKLKCVWLEEIGDVGWQNVPTSRNSLKWCIRSVEGFENERDVECGSVVGRLKRWLWSCGG